MKLVFWLSVLTEHQVHLMRAIRDLGAEMTIVVGTTQLEERQAQGWVPPDISDLDVVAPAPAEWAETVAAMLARHPEALHVFGGILADRRYISVIARAQRRGIRTVVMSEPYAAVPVSYFGGRVALRERVKHLLRPFVYRAIGLLIGRKLHAIFPFSELAERQFTRSGFRGPHYPFGYFVPRTPSGPVARGDTPGLRLVFVGALLPRKGVDILLRALSLAREILGGAAERLTLDIYGPGTLATLPPGARACGAIPFGEVQLALARYDALVLPSRFDGWGVVVNEALLQGVPAIVSDAVGAQALVLRGNAGAVFHSGDASALADLLVDAVRHPEHVTAWKSGASAIAPDLEPAVAARYFLDCLQHAESASGPPPSAPWYPA